MYIEFANCVLLNLLVFSSFVGNSV